MLNVVFCNFIKIIRQGCIRGEEASTRNGISSSGLSENGLYNLYADYLVSIFDNLSLL